MRFDVMENLKNFAKFLGTKQGPKIFLFSKFFTILQHISSILRPCLVHAENQKIFKIFSHIKSYDTYMKY